MSCSSGLPVLTVTDKLRLSASKGQFDKVHEFIKLGVTFDSDKEGRTALHYAAINGHADVCKLLIDSKCEVNLRDINGCTALHRATAQGHLSAIETLLDGGCDVDLVDENGNSPLHEAAWNGFSKTLELLVKHECNIQIANKAGFTALHLSAQNGHNESSRILLYAGTNPDLKNNYGDTALHTAARYGHAGVTRILISARCRLNEQNKNGDTALHISSALKRRKIAKLLVEAGVDVNIKNKQNENALDVARRKEHPEIILIITSYHKPDQIQSKLTKDTREILFTDIPSAPVVEPDEDPPTKCDPPDKVEKPEKERGLFSIFKKKKKDKDKEKKEPSQQMSSPQPNNDSQNGPDSKRSVKKGFFSEYTPKPGVQYFRDLAGNIKQGPIGYTPLCHCVPHVRKLEQKWDADRNHIYDHIDASTQMLKDRIDVIDRRGMQQGAAIERFSKEGHPACRDHFEQRLKEERLEREREFKICNQQTTKNIENWLDNKISDYSHCLDHHHDDTAIPSRNIMLDVHQTAFGRLYKTRSDETLSQSDCSGRYRKKQFYESRQAAMQQIRAWQLPNEKDAYRRREHKNLTSTPSNKYSDRNNNGLSVHFSDGPSTIGQASMINSPPTISDRRPVSQEFKTCMVNSYDSYSTQTRTVPRSQTEPSRLGQNFNKEPFKLSQNSRCAFDKSSLPVSEPPTHLRPVPRSQTAPNGFQTDLKPSDGNQVNSRYCDRVQTSHLYASKHVQFYSSYDVNQNCHMKEKALTSFKQDNSNINYNEDKYNESYRVNVSDKPYKHSVNSWQHREDNYSRRSITSAYPHRASSTDVLLNSRDVTSKPHGLEVTSRESNNALLNSCDVSSKPQHNNNDERTVYSPENYHTHVLSPSSSTRLLPSDNKGGIMSHSSTGIVGDSPENRYSHPYVPFNSPTNSSPHESYMQRSFSASPPRAYHYSTDSGDRCNDLSNSISYKPNQIPRTSQSHGAGPLNTGVKPKPPPPPRRDDTVNRVSGPSIVSNSNNYSPLPTSAGTSNYDRGGTISRTTCVNDSSKSDVMVSRCSNMETQQCDNPSATVNVSPANLSNKSQISVISASLKEPDSSSNPDSGYSSKIYGTNNNMTTMGGSTVDSTHSNTGTPSSSFSTDHSVFLSTSNQTSSFTNIHGENIQPRQYFREPANSNLWYQDNLYDTSHRMKESGQFSKLLTYDPVRGSDV